MRVAFLLAALLLPALTARAGTPEVVLRTSVAPEADLVVGQRVVLRVDVLAKDGWAQVRDLPPFEVPGATVLRTSSQGIRLNETIDGDAYSGQRYELSLYPRRDGDFTVPALPLHVSIRRWGAGESEEEHAAPSVSFRASWPPGAQGVRDLVATTRLTAKQAWGPESGEAGLRVGDAIRRTVIVEADDVSGMAFPPLDTGAIPGVGVYPASPEVDDRTNRGALTGTRSDTVTFVFERAGAVTFPDVAVVWYDLAKKEVRREVLPGRTLSIAPGPAAAVVAAEEEETGGSRWWLLVLLAMPGLILAFRRPFLGSLAAWREARRESEPAYFRRFVRAARAGEAPAAGRTLLAWLDRTHEGPGVARLDA
ncbi:MAG: BatD family protein, partial [Planctomycetota bacterium]